MNENILKWLSNPKNVGQMRDSDGTGKVKGGVCKDFSKLFIKVENGIIKETKFQTFGGPVSIASVSVVSELIKFKTLDEALLINMNDVLAELGKVDADDLACVENAVSLIPSAVNNYFRKLNRKNDDENKKPKELEKKSEIKVVNIDKNNETPKGKEEEIDIFSEIDAITAKISEAVNKLKNETK